MRAALRHPPGWHAEHAIQMIGHCARCDGPFRKAPERVDPPADWRNHAPGIAAGAGMVRIKCGVEFEIIIPPHAHDGLAVPMQIGNDGAEPGGAGYRFQLNRHRMIVKVELAMAARTAQKPLGRLIDGVWPYR